MLPSDLSHELEPLQAALCQKMLSLLKLCLDRYTLICIKQITNKNLPYKKINKIKFKNKNKTNKKKALSFPELVLPQIHFLFIKQNYAYLENASLNNIFFFNFPKSQPTPLMTEVLASLTSPSVGCESVMIWTENRNCWTFGETIGNHHFLLIRFSSVLVNVHESISYFKQSKFRTDNSVHIMKKLKS